ncbi:unnamed protein product [Brugia timori]|uniref:Uncharacterized protein n=1 Tax=Brugia timori TaxID=42155 RepID=A0A0R3QPK6_9BILA|nr:unnamed protein product [Brugia timori]
MANRDWYFFILQGPLLFCTISVFFFFFHLKMKKIVKHTNSNDRVQIKLYVKQELMPLNELPCSDEEASISSAFSTATTITSGPSIVTSTNMSTEGMSSGEAIPYLSVGPYHQRPAPILTDNAFVGGDIVDCCKVFSLWKEGYHLL